MRIVHVITDLVMGGAERALVRLALQQHARGDHVTVVALKHAGVVARPLKEAGVPVVELGAPAEPGPLLAFAVADLAAVLRGADADVVHAWLATACAAVKLVAPRGLPRVFAARVTDVPPAAVCALLRASDRNPVQWLAVSRAVAVAWAYALGCSAADFVIAPNGVEVAKTGPSPAGARPVFLGRLAHQKGVDILLRALAGTDLEVDIHGDGPEGDALHALAEQLDVAHQARFHGSTTRPEAALARSSMLVLPSRSEGMPNAALEAMASGRAVVASRVPGTDEVVEDGVTGLLVGVDDPDALREALVGLQADPNRRARMGAAGRKRVRSEFTLARELERTDEAYRAVLERA